MLGRAHRLVNRRLTQRIFRSGAWQVTRHINLKYLPVAQGFTGQAAFVVAKKVAKYAVDRNRFKRQLRAAYQSVAADPVLGPRLTRYHIILTGKQFPRENGYQVLVEELRTAVTRIAERK